MIVPMCAAICVIVVSIIALTNIFAWFYFPQDQRVDNITFSVRGEDKSGIMVEYVDSDGELLGGLENGFYPGDFVYLHVKMINTREDNASVYRNITLSSLAVTYPTQKTVDNMPYTIPNEVVDADDYYYDAIDIKFDIFSITAPSQRYEFYTSLIAPASNAYRYDVFRSLKTDFIAGDAIKYLTTATNATPAQLVNANPNVIINTEAILTLASSEDQSNNGRFLVTSEHNSFESNYVSAYLVLYFDPSIYSRVSLNNEVISYRTSNPFEWQDLTIVLDFIDEVA